MTRLKKNEAQQSISNANAFEFIYGFTFGYDACGDFSTGETIRKAIIAKVEECPVTLEAKEKFYKDVAEMGNEVLLAYASFLATHSLSELIANNKDARCDDPHKKAAEDLIRERITQYKEGKIKLTDILIDIKIKGHIGEIIDCAEISKSGDPFDMGGHTGADMAHAANGGVAHGSTGK